MIFEELKRKYSSNAPNSMIIQNDYGTENSYTNRNTLLGNSSQEHKWIAQWFRRSVYIVQRVVGWIII